MGDISIQIEFNYNQISVKKKHVQDFSKKLEAFLDKWKKVVQLFEGRFLFIKEGAKENKYYFFQDEDQELEISSYEYLRADDKTPSFARNFIKYLCKAEDNDDVYEYSFGLHPFEEQFYIDLYNLTKDYGEISFIGNVSSSNSNGYWNSTYDLTENGVEVDATFCD
jgi:hypothetical protein